MTDPSESARKASAQLQAWLERPSNCPYCGTHAGPDVRACPACGRDIDLLRELYEYDRAPPDRNHEEPGKMPRVLRWQRGGKIVGALSCRAATRYGSAIVVLALAHALVLFVFDARIIYSLVAALVIPIASGFSMGIRIRGNGAVNFALITAVPASLLAVVTLALPLWFSDRLPLLPQTAQEWREAVQFALTIFFGFATGIFLAQSARWGMGDPVPASNWVRKCFSPEHLDSQDAHAALHRAQARFAQVGALLSVVAGVIAMLHRYWT